ncbi:MAG: nitronate monooxygenase [Chloroflexi bacterium]|nr:MAG: nitronate monooxygenase [Chloroflexota bacterium]
MFSTRITKLFGIKYPIIQGGMQWVSRAELAAAVSNAGGLGILSALTFSPEELRLEIRKMRELTDKPFGVNLTLLPALRPVKYEEYIEVILQEGVGIVETAGRNPEPYMKLFREGAVKVIHKCTAVRFARTAERVGCSAVSIDGFECAGHPGEEDVTSLILIPLAAEAVNIPVIASGGFADARGFVAALALGAEGVNMGTRMLATQEAPVHPRVKERLLQASERDTMLILRSLRNTQRVLRNRMAERVAELEKRGAGLEELAPLISGERGRQLLQGGDLEEGLLTCGQAVGLIRDIPTVKELIETVISEARMLIQNRLARLI